MVLNIKGSVSLLYMFKNSFFFFPMVFGQQMKTLTLVSVFLSIAFLNTPNNLALFTFRESSLRSLEILMFC